MTSLKAVFLALVVACSSLKTSEVTITSPDTAQTYAFSDAIQHRLYWNEKEGILEALITFSNHRYASREEPPAEDSFNFRFPGVKFKQENNTFYIESKSDEEIAIAELKQFFLFKNIEPLPSTLIHIFKKSGNVSVALSINTGIIFKNHWIED